MKGRIATIGMRAVKLVLGLAVSFVFWDNSFCIEYNSHPKFPQIAFQEKNIPQEKQLQIQQNDLGMPDPNLLNKSVEVDAQKLWKLSMLVAEYKQAYEFAKQKLEDSIQMNEEMTKTLKLQLQIIEDMRAKISALEKQVRVLKSNKAKNGAPIPYPKEKPIPIT